MGEAHDAKTYVLAIVLEDRAAGGVRCKGYVLAEPCQVMSEHGEVETSRLRGKIC